VLYRAYGAAAYVLRLLPRLLFGRCPQLILALTSPPYLGLAALLAGRLRGVPVVHWVMDVYPDVLEAEGVCATGSRWLRLLRQLTAWQLRGAARVITLSPYMQQRVQPYLAHPLDAVTVPLWGRVAAPEAQDVASLRRARGWTPSDTVLLYSGNLGRGHRFDEFLEGARRLGAAGPLWAFAGDGARRKQVEQFQAAHPRARVQLLPYVEEELLGASLAAADVHLASLSSAWQGLIVPSKVQAAFAVGRPVLFVGPGQNDVAAWIRASGGGWVVPEGDVAALLAAVEGARDPAERDRRGRAADAFAREHFHRGHNLARLVKLLEDAAAVR